LLGIFLLFRFERTAVTKIQVMASAVLCSRLHAAAAAGKCKRAASLSKAICVATRTTSHDTGAVALTTATRPHYRLSKFNTALRKCRHPQSPAHPDCRAGPFNADTMLQGSLKVTICSSSGGIFCCSALSSSRACPCQDCTAKWCRASPPYVTVTGQRQNKAISILFACRGITSTSTLAKWHRYIPCSNAATITSSCPIPYCCSANE
jgi:hypothetical protein